MSLRLHGVAQHVEPAGSDALPLFHADLVDRLLTVAPQPAEPGPDLVVLVNAAPDTQGHKTTASWLNLRTGGAAHSFALTGQGVGGPFTALRVADACARTGRGGSALLAVVECAGADGASDASGVLLRLDDRAGGAAVEVAAVPTKELAGELAALVPERGQLLLVLGPGTDPGVAPGERTEVRTAPETSSCTAVWRVLATKWAASRDRCPVVALCAADPVTATTHLAVLRDLDEWEPPAGGTEGRGNGRE
ncbi:hypothetical protein [Streptacidiphilus anmyonensis]|uniref:hypothetical protein n=1 Tax=Streptacidiphilus anmyonensis TaxID=405782 RepID=UPI000694DFA1|nr:hypothetical protein [Streptacidiphilus anmyonensis]